MALHILLKLWLLYVTLDLFQQFCALCSHLGYHVLHNHVQHSISTSRLAQYDRLLEMREEVSDMDQYQRRLEAELDALPDQSSSDSSDPDESS